MSQAVSSHPRGGGGDAGDGRGPRGGGGGAGRGGSQKRRASSLSAVPRQPWPPLLTDLPEEVYPQLMAFLPRWDRESLRRASKAVREGILSSTHTLVLRDCRARKPQALIDLLRRTTGLQRLAIQTKSLTGGEAERLLVAAIGEGQVGATLQTLELWELDGALVLPLIGHLSNGQLPLLMELELPLNSNCDIDALGQAVAEALESRSKLTDEQGNPLNLPPLVRFQGISGYGADSLQRIWACCPPNAVSHFETAGGSQLAALGEYMQEHATLPALESIVLGGVSDDDDDEQALSSLTRVMEGLNRNWTPKLHTLELCGSSLARSIGPLGTVIWEGKLPNLTKLVLNGCTWPSDDFRALMDGLVAAPNCLRALALDDVRLSEADIQYLAGALRAAGGLERLEELTLLDVKDVQHSNLDPILHALGEGARCSQTLKVISLEKTQVARSGGRAFTQAMGGGAFPSLI